MPSAENIFSECNGQALNNTSPKSTCPEHCDKLILERKSGKFSEAQRKAHPHHRTDSKPNIFPLLQNKIPQRIQVSKQVFLSIAKKIRLPDRSSLKQDVCLNHLHQIHGQLRGFLLTMFSEITKPFNLKLPKDSLSSADTQPVKCQPKLKLSKCIST